MADGWIWPTLLGVLGLVFGSFVATVALRWPGSALQGRSACDACGATLRGHELVPLFSYIAQRGRCRRCGAPIAIAHPLVELIGAAIGISAGVAAPGLAGAAGAVFGWLLLALGAIDWAAMVLPNILNAVLALTGILAAAAGIDPPLYQRLIGGAVGIGALWAVAKAYRAARGRLGLGGGDPKMFGAISLWLGWRALPLTLLVASLLGLFVVAVLQRRGTHLPMTTALPFGCLLAAAAWLVWLARAAGITG